MPTITSTGVASGMDFESIIQSSLQVKQAQLEKQVTRKKEETNIELTGVGKLKSALGTFKTALETLKKDTSFNVRKFTSNQDSEKPVFSVTTKEDATNCKFDVEVQQLATSEKLSKTFDKDWGDKDKHNTGSFTIYLGKDKTTNEKINVTASSTKDSLASITISVTAEDTLETIRKKINKNDFGLTASIIHAENGDQLIIDTGMTGKGAFENNGTTSNIWIEETPEDKNKPLGFAMNPKQLTKQSSPDNNYQNNDWNQTAGTQAIINVDGSTLVSDTNTFDKQISGIELTVNRVSEPNVTNTLEVSQDIDGITKKVTDLLDAYNTLMDTMDGLYKRNTYENGKNKMDGGELAGDSQLKTLQSTLSNIMTSFNMVNQGSATNGSGLDIYSLGLEVDKSGHFSLDTTKFKEGVKDNFNAVVNLFTKEAEKDPSSGDPQPKTAGLIHQLFDVVDSYTKSDGILSNREDQLNDRIRDYEAKEANNASYLEKYEENLRIKYSKLDVTIGNANQSMMYMQSVLAGMAPMGAGMI